MISVKILFKKNTKIVYRGEYSVFEDERVGFLVKNGHKQPENWEKSDIFDLKSWKPVFREVKKKSAKKRQILKRF